MDYHAQQELFKKVNQAIEAGDKAKQLGEAISRRHAELDQKLAILNERLARLEEILAPELEARQKKLITTGDGSEPQQKGLLSRLIGK